MHCLSPFPAAIRPRSLSLSLLLLMGTLACSSSGMLHAQIRGGTTLKPDTATSPREFRPLANMPAEQRAPMDPVVAQAAPQPQQQPTSPTQPAPGGPGGFPGGPGGGFGRGGFGRGGASSSTEELFRIDGDKVSLQFPNNTITDILGIYERLTNKTLVKDTTIFEGQTISLVTPVPVDKAEAIKLIEAALLTNGYAIVADPDGKSSRILSTRTTTATSGAQFSQGVKFYQSANDLPDNETIVSYFMGLTNLDPTEAATMLGGHVGLNPYGRITPVVSPPGLLITENANIVKQLVAIREVIDTPGAASSLVTKFVLLKYADAATVAQIVQATLNAQAQDKEAKGITTIRGQGTSGGGGGDNRQQQQQQQSSNNNNNNQQGGNRRIQATSQVIADTRLNQVLVVAEPDEYAYVVSLIAEFDKPVDVPAAYERKLKNVFSVDVLSVLADMLREPVGGTAQLPGGGSVSGQNQQQLITSSNQFLTGTTGAQQRGGTFNASAASTATTGTTGGVTSRPDLLLESEEQTAPVSVLINKTRLIADPLANSIIVIGPKENQDKVDMLLDKLDRKAPQVYLATVIGQLTLGDGYQFGINYLQRFTESGNGGVASALITRDDIITNNNVSDMTTNLITSAIANTNGFNLYGQIGESVDVFVSALETTNDFKVLSRPSVFAQNNRRAMITSGQQIPVPESTLTNASSQNQNNQGNVTTTITYKDVVLKLEVIPLINPDGDVTLRIAQVNDTVIGNQIVADNTVPIIGTEQLTTTVTVPTGNTIVIGGLISEQFKTDTQGIPVISRIPGIGRLFKEDVTSKQRKELIVFIQPVVVTDDFAVRKASKQEDLRTKAGESAYHAFPQTVVPKAVPVTDPDPPVKRKWYEIFKKTEGIPSSPPPPRNGTTTTTETRTYFPRAK
ncbi:type II secretion system protein D [Roseimicrobium gellanilyticum]|uniref:Type II secretion system protein D n=1 Tax=Roseimicrobium gellanilyticum TaxID=748857 RepID=A0A366H3P6_9BACT|nr:secretin N-terminal domain-containing protein [Roseimicrobium gellanilyticum]RBP35695.1 type II secretion system protein D [Roseimicrobium gellanilyticum]